MRYVGAPTGLIFVGFDWQGIEVLARNTGITFDGLIIDKLRILEDLAIEYYNKGGETNGKG